MIIPPWPECSRRRFNRVSNWSFISRLLYGRLFRLEFLCRNRHVIGTVPSPIIEFEASTALDSDPERESDMVQIEPLDSHESCEPSLRPLSRSSLVFMGRDSRGNWVVRDHARLCGALFVNRCEALRFAMFENGRRPRAVIMVPGILEFSIGRPAKAVLVDSTGVAEAKPEPAAEVAPRSLFASQLRERGFMVAAQG